jgi:hypothetical protein
MPEELNHRVEWKSELTGLQYGCAWALFRGMTDDYGSDTR